MDISTIFLGGTTAVMAVGCGWLLARMRASGVPLFGGNAPQRGASEALESVLEGLGDACLILNSRREIIFANHETRDLFRGRGPLRGMPLADLISDQRILAFTERVAQGNRWQEEQFRVTLDRAGGPGERWLVVSAAPVQLPGEDTSRHLRIVIRDETDRHETDQVRKDFVANASHELRTPLSIINGYLENLIEGVIDDPAQVRRGLITMQKHGERIARIVEDMLTLSKFESVEETGQVQLRGNSFSCRELVEEVVERLTPRVEEKKARMVLSFPAGGKDVLAGDRFYWDQIFFNLIENALKENEPGVVISVTMERRNGEAVMEVRDNGVGIPQEDLPFIFKRFYRVAKDHSQSRIKGTGLGLSIVRRAVEAHGGTISVRSTRGTETVFTIRLPDVAAPVPEAPAAASAPEH